MFVKPLLIIYERIKLKGSVLYKGQIAFRLELSEEWSSMIPVLS